ncbi:MAG: deoxyribodipyrimidine photo-lyase [Gammaproteobacteria bacterium]
MAEPVIVWFRRDLRLSDNPALDRARRSRQPLIPVYIFAPDEETPWQPGGASRYWLHESLQVLEEGLQRLGSRLILRRGDSLAELEKLARETGAEALFWNRLYEPALRKRDRRIETAMKQRGIDVQTFPGHLINEPDTVATKQGSPFKVFTPYWKHCRQLQTTLETVGGIRTLPVAAQWPASDSMESLELVSRIKWYDGIDARWTPGFRGAESALQRFIKEAAAGYATQRDIPSRDGVSSLSPHLHFGEITPRRVIKAMADADRSRGLLSLSAPAEAFVRQLYWRDFAHYLLHHFPRTPTQPLYDKFRHFPWRKNKRLFTAWSRGQTGYPIVDAGMRELWQTGWMHNRVRMIAASFLIKDLMIHWREGAKWFWDTLVDADLANNTMGWQWVAGCGADAAPFFRIFNPVTQGERFDAGGDYVRRWVPELAQLDNRFIHKPWLASPVELEAAGIRPGRDYPDPVVDHAEARKRALAAYKRIQ